MKKILLLVLCLSGQFLFAQNNTIENIIVITTDGFRWQEVFGGADSAIAEKDNFNQKQKAELYARYGAKTPQERRKKLLPFLWSTVATQGQICGNRNYGNFVNNANPYWFSYPGYSEIFTGNVDTAINTNSYPANPHTNVLEYINKQPGFTGKVAAFGAWDAFDRILNEQRSGITVISGMDSCGGTRPDSTERLINRMKHDAYTPFGAEEHLDVFTHYMAMDDLQKQHPRVLYISYGETDEWAHAGKYLDYLDAAHRVDQWLGEIWNYVQSTPQYKDKTVLFVTVDHGRGLNDQWTSHNNKIPYSNQIWFAAIGPNIKAEGENKKSQQVYQKQYAQTFAELLGLNFKCEHPVADGLKKLLTK